MEPFVVSFYDKPDGSEPAKEFLLSLEPKMQAKMLRTIHMLEVNGYELREPCSKSLGDGIFELRAKVSTNITRILYFFYVGRHIVLTNGFVKKTSKTPPSEIALAKKYRSEFLSRKENQL